MHHPRGAAAEFRRFLAGPWADRVLAAAFLVAAELEVVLTVGGPLWRQAVTAVTSLGVAGLAWRRRWPLLPIALLCGLALVTAAVTGGDPGGVPLLAVFVAAYSLGAHAGWRALAPGLALPLATVAALDAVWLPGHGLGDSLPFVAVFVVGLPALAGIVIRDRRRLVTRLRERTSELQAERAERGRHALGAERLRIAHDLHAIVSSTVRGLLSEVARAESGSPEEGLRAVTQVEEIARRGLVEMRRLLAALTSDEETLRPEAGGLGAALSRAAAAGAEVVRSGELDVEAAAPVELAAARVVELFCEGATPQLRIEVSGGDDDLRLLLTGGGAGGLEAAGRVALEQRVALAGGTWDAVPDAAGSGVRVVLPLHPGPVPAPPVPDAPAAPAPPASPAGPLARAWAWPWPVALATAVFVMLEVQVQTSDLLRGPRALNLLAGLAVAAPLVWWRSRPLVVSAASLLAALAMSVTLTPITSLAAGTALFVLLPFGAAAFLGVGPAAVGLGLCAAALVGGGALGLPGMGTVPEALSVLPYAAGAWLAGWVVQDHRRLAAELRETNRGLAAERDATARAIVVEERARVARDLHDVVGHSLTVIVLQAGAARRVWGVDRAGALAALATLAGVAREQLTELLRSLESLDADRGGLPDLDGLLEMARLAGVELQVRVEGEREPLEPAAELASYRVVQEALTNAIKHAPGSPVALVIRYRERCMELEASNELRPGAPGGRPLASGGGSGLCSMRERVEACGGTLEWGGRDGAFSLQARLPVA